ncbi:MAG: MFS transporter [Streptosporangiales bacterium]|nr:MFS transporter [Streptosporangiales bacterium]
MDGVGVARAPRGFSAAGFGTALALAMGIGPLATYVISATGPLVTAGLDLSRTQLGSIATVTFLAAALASVLAGRAVDVFSARAVMVLLFIGAGVALLAVAAAPSYTWLLLAVTVSGAFQALSNPVTNQLISANVPEGRRGVLMGVKQSGLSAAVVGGVGLAARIYWGRVADRMRRPHQLLALLAVVQVSELSVVGAASGVLALGQYLGFAVGPVSLGAVVDGLGTYTPGWASVAVVYAAATGLVLLWRGRDGPGVASASTPMTSPVPGTPHRGQRPRPGRQEG